MVHGLFQIKSNEKRGGGFAEMEFSMVLKKEHMKIPGVS